MVSRLDAEKDDSETDIAVMNDERVHVNNVRPPPMPSNTLTPNTRPKARFVDNRETISNPIQATENKTCDHCKRSNHTRNECWRLLGLCLVCGSNEHRIGACPKRRIHQSNNESTATGGYDPRRGDYNHNPSTLN